MITVIGCGVIGLTSALRLREAGHPAQILAERLPPHTTSDKAGALCFPFKAGPPERCLSWASESLGVYSREAALPGAFVTEVDCLVLEPSPARDIPWQMTRLGPERLRRAEASELPGGYADGFVIRVPLIQCGPYLQSLMERFLAAGGLIRQASFMCLEDAPGDTLINCTGLGARVLAADELVAPVSGHILAVRPASPSAPVRCFICEGGKDTGGAPTYAFPRPDRCVLGGTAVHGDWYETVDPAIIHSIRERTVRIVPALANAEEISRYVGLRPYRPEVRLEAGRLPDGRPVIHNYGHGGSGWTLSWGCAAEVLTLI
ncbi:MAG: D-amino-acid [Desulfovibrionaceae bacterium]|nr:MAG: D-amino-acid [Desulfovibrionaceae bacterium]